MPHPVDVQVGQRLKELRQLRGMSQSDLGKRMNLQFSQIQKYEVASNRISASKLHELSKILGVSPDYFFDGTEPVLDHQCMATQFQSELEKVAPALIKKALTQSFPDIRDRAAYLVDLILSERARFALVPIPNDKDELDDYYREDTFLRTLEVGLVALHSDLPTTQPNDLTDDKSRELKARVVALAKLVDSTVQYLDTDKGTYGGLYKIGLIAGIATLLSTIPGVNFLTGAMLPTAIFGAQTVRLRISKDK